MSRWQEIVAHIEALQLELNSVRKACEHEYVPEQQDSESATCAKCGSNPFAWYCVASPTKLCEYERGNEWCIHCGYPEERK